MVTFSPDAHQMLHFARKEADRLRHQYVGTEHLLLGMVKAGEGTAYEFLKALTPDLAAFCSEIENGASVDRDESRASSPYSERFRRVMALADLEAAELNGSFVGSEHLLLGLLRDGGGHAAAVLQRLGVDADGFRRSLVV